MLLHFLEFFFFLMPLFPQSYCPLKVFKFSPVSTNYQSRWDWPGLSAGSNTDDGIHTPGVTMSVFYTFSVNRSLVEIPNIFNREKSLEITRGHRVVRLDIWLIMLNDNMEKLDSTFFKKSLFIYLSLWRHFSRVLLRGSSHRGVLLTDDDDL